MGQQRSARRHPSARRVYRAPFRPKERHDVAFPLGFARGACSPGSTPRGNTWRTRAKNARLAENELKGPSKVLGRDNQSPKPKERTQDSQNGPGTHPTQYELRRGHRHQYVDALVVSCLTRCENGRRQLTHRWMPVDECAFPASGSWFGVLCGCPQIDKHGYANNRMSHNPLQSANPSMGKTPRIPTQDSKPEPVGRVRAMGSTPCAIKRPRNLLSMIGGCQLPGPSLTGKNQGWYRISSGNGVSFRSSQGLWMMEDGGRGIPTVRME